jgi:hypothetical protein
MPVRIRTLARVCACLLMLAAALILMAGFGPKLTGLDRDQLTLLGRAMTGVWLLLGIEMSHRANSRS